MTSLIREERCARVALPTPRHVLRFSELCRTPKLYVGRIAAALALWWPDLDTERMTSVVLPRADFDRCEPDLHIEETLVQQVETAA